MNSYKSIFFKTFIGSLFLLQASVSSSNEAKMCKSVVPMKIESLSSKLKTEGVLFYLIKGTGNLPKPADRKGIVERGVLEIALPIMFNSKEHRVVLKYKSHIANGERYQILSKISVVAPNGEKLNLREEVIARVIKEAKESPGPYTFDLDGNKLYLLGKIEPKYVKEYKEFFSRFYTSYSKKEGNPREIEEFSEIQSKKDLAKYIFKMKVQNGMQYVWSRTHRVAMQGILTAVVFAAMMNPNVKDFFGIEPDAQPPVDLSGLVIEVKTPTGPFHFKIKRDDSGDLIGKPLNQTDLDGPHVIFNTDKIDSLKSE